jgi:hypothetical protein
MGKFKAMGQVTPSDEVVELGVYDTLEQAELAIVKAGGGAAFWLTWVEDEDPKIAYADIEIPGVQQKPKKR